MEQLFRRARAGNRQARNQLLRQLLPALRITVRSELGPYPPRAFDLDDACQTVCVHLLGHLDRLDFRGEQPFRVWLRRLVVRRLRDLKDYHTAKKRTGSSARSLDGVELEAVVGETSLRSRNRGRADVQAEHHELAGIALDVVAGMPQLQAELIRLIYWESVTITQAAHEMGMTEANARYHLRKAQATLAWELIHRTQ